MRTAIPTAILLALPGLAAAQSNVFGIDLLNDDLFRTHTTAFVADYAVLGAVARPIRALDFDAPATTLWGIDNSTREYGTLDPSSGAFTVLGTIGGTFGLTGLTAAPDGVTWYLSTFDAVAGESKLYVGDITTGSFSVLGTICAETVIDISMDSQGRLFGTTVTDDSLYRIDPATGAGTRIGSLGIAINFAQGIDFDWSDDLLYATLQGEVPGTSLFAVIDTQTGAAEVLEDVAVLGAEMEMAVRVRAFDAVSYCFGDGSGTPCPCGNAGAPTAGCANGSFASGARLVAEGPWYEVGLRIDHGTPNQPVLFFEGRLPVNGGAGLAFGDGLRCAGGSVTRLRTEQFDANGSVELTGSVQSNGGGALGEQRTYQGWYRDPAGSPCGAGFNLTNGVLLLYPPLP